MLSEGKKFNKLTVAAFAAVIVLVSLVVVNFLPLARKDSQASASFLANWNQASLNAMVGNGDTTAYTESTLPKLVDGGYGGSGQALQASRGDTLKYKTAGNLDNQKVEYSMQINNQYNLTGVDQGKARFSPGDIWGMDYDSSTGYFYVVDRTSDRIIKTNWDGTVWEVLEGMFSDPKHVKFDASSGYLYISDGNYVIKTKMDGTGFTKLGGFSEAKGLDYDPATGYLYVVNRASNQIIKTKIDGTGWTTFGSGGSGVNQFNFGSDIRGDVDYDPASGYLYIADGYNKRIVKTQIDGTGWTTLGVSDYIMNIQYEASSGNIYVQGHDYGHHMLRTKIDGSDQVATNFGSYWQRDFVWDSVTSKYYTVRGGGGTGYCGQARTMVRANLDGSSYESSVHNHIYPYVLYRPLSVFYSDGKITISNYHSQIAQFNEDGTGFRTFGGAGHTAGLFDIRGGDWGGGVYYDSAAEKVYVSNGYDSNVIKTDMDVSIWQSTGIGYFTTDVYYDSASEFIYGVSANDRINKKKIDGSGAVSYGTNGSGVGQFADPSGIWYDSASEFIYIADKDNNRIVKTKIDGTGWTVLGGFSSPRGIQYDPVTEYLYVANYGSSQIIKTKIDGTGWTTLGGFSNPNDVSYDPATDYIYVADYSNNRIVKTKMDGTGWTNMTLDSRRVLMKTQGDEMRLELDLYSQRLKFWMKRATGGIFLQSEPLDWGVDEWHKPAVSFNRATGRVELKIDDVVVDSAEDMTWTSSPPNFGEYVYVSTDPANPDAVNISPIDDFTVDVETIDTVDPENPTTVRAYDSSTKSVEFSDQGWGNSANPYFEFSGASDDLTGVLGYWVYFGAASDGEPFTAGTYQEHVGSADTVQNFTSNSKLVSGTTYYLRIRTRDNDYNYSDAATLFTYKYDGGAPDPPEFINFSPVGCSTSPTFTFTWPKVEEAVSGIAGYEYKKGSTGTPAMVPNLNLEDEIYSFETTPYQEGDNVFYVRTVDNAGNRSVWQTTIFCSTGIAHVIDGPTITTGPSSLTVSWVSSKKTTGFIEVKDGNIYREPQGHLGYEISHKVTVNGLRSESSYQYRIVWQDENKNSGETEWFTITTLALPKIIDLKTEVISPSRALVRWRTNYPSSATLQWGSSNLEDAVKISGPSNEFSYQIDGLIGGSNYMLSIKCTTLDGTDFSSGATFSSPPLPAFSGLKFDAITSNAQVAVKVSWFSNVATTSTVFYGPKGGPKQEVTKSDKTLDHEIIISQLNDNTLYEIYASGIDEFGNIATSDINTFSTPLDTRPPTITDIVIETSNVGIGKEDKAQAAISYSTDESAKCLIEYAEGISGDNYSNKTPSDEAMSNTHLTIITDLSPQTPYHFRIICSDKGNNQTTSSSQTIISGEVTQSVFSLILKTLNNLFGWLGKLSM